MGSLDDAVGAGGVAAIGAGLVGLGAAAVAIPLLAAPAGGSLAIGGVAAGGVFAVGAFLEVLQQLKAWGVINWRPAPAINQPAVGEDYLNGSATNVNFVVRLSMNRTNTGRSTCGSSPESLPDTSSGPSELGGSTYNGVGIRINRSQRVITTQCGSGSSFTGTSGPIFLVLKADGSTSNGLAYGADGGSFTNLGAGTQTDKFSNFRFIRDGVTTTLENVEPQAFAPGTRPQLFPLTVPDAPTLPPPPVTIPPVRLPPAPPDRRPLAPPVTLPRPGQQPARVPAPGPSPTPSPGPGPAPTPAQPAPQQVPAVGPLPLPLPLPVPTTPAEVVVVDGQIIGGPAQAPAPNLVAMATELGRLEAKAELGLSRPANGGSGPLPEGSILRVLEDLIQAVLTELLNDVPGGSFYLVPPCPPPGGGDPLPAVEVEYGGGSNPTAAVLAKLDGLAQLLQVHKDMGQPSCKTVIYGEEVTVQFEEL